jgi:hypothetical protein
VHLSHALGKRGLLLLAGLLLLGPLLPASGKGKVTVERVEYKGWKNNLRLRNGAVELVITLDVGPRIISYRREGGDNVLKEYTDQLGKSGEKEWQIRGGHRLWAGPEDLTRTYALDNGPLTYKELEGGVIRLISPEDREHGLQKEIDVTLAATGSRVQLVHRITNVGEKAATLAPWALTVMAPGGMEIIPLPRKKPHPGSPKNAKSPRDFAPNQRIVLWPFFDFKDPRWTFGSRWITLRQDAKRGPTKIGLAHRLGWVAYANAGTLFVKRLAYESGKRYPDRGCNFETFTNEDMLEIESLGPLCTLGKGEKTELTETWHLHKLAGELRDEADIERNVMPLVKKGSD